MTTRRDEPTPTRDRIVAAAVELFASSGYGSSSLRDIAALATVNVASIYHYFASKDELLVHIIEGVLRGTYEPAQQHVDQAAGPAHALVALTRHHVGFHCRHAAETAISDRELGVLAHRVRTRLVAMRDAYEQLWDETLQTGSEQGVFRIDNLEIARMAILTMCSQVAAWYRPAGKLTVGEVADAYAHLVLRIVGYRPSPPVTDG